jgi:hypothetical protein
MAKPVQLTNGRSWGTQSAAKTHFKDILNRHADGQLVTDPVDHSDLLALLEAYDRDMSREARKSGTGVDHFFRDRDQEHNGLTSCFYVRRADGSSIDFSYLRAVETASRR